MIQPKRMLFVAIFFLCSLLNTTLTAQSIERGEISVFRRNIEAVRYPPPAFWEAKVHHERFSLVARNQIKNKYLSECGMILWTGNPNRFFNADTSAMIEAVRLAGRRGTAMQLGILVKGDVNDCRRSQVLRPFQNLCRGGTLSSEKSAATRKTTASSNWWDDFRRWMVRKEETPIAFYEQCLPVPMEGNRASRCASSPATPTGIEFKAPSAEEVGHKFGERNIMGGSPVGPKSTAESRTGKVSQGGSGEPNDGMTIVTQSHRMRHRDPNTTRDFDTNEDGAVFWNHTSVIEINTNGDYTLYDFWTGEGLADGTYNSEILATGNYYDNPSSQPGRSIVENALNTDDTRVYYHGDDSEDGDDGEEGAASEEDESAGTPMCDFSTSEECGGDYTLIMIAFGNSLPGFPSTPGDSEVRTDGAIDCPPEARDCAEGGSANFDLLPGTPTVHNDPLAPLINPGLDDSGKGSGSPGALPCGMLEYEEVGRPIDDTCMDPMNPDCADRTQRGIKTDPVINPQNKMIRERSVKDRKVRQQVK